MKRPPLSNDDPGGLTLDLARGLDPASIMTEAGYEPDQWQRDLLEDDSDRISILASRQVGKSTTCAALALHQAIYDPGPVLMIAPSLRQSGELFKKFREVHSRLKVKPDVEQESTLKLELANGSRVMALPGSEATLRGYSAVKLILIDEAARVDDSLYAALRPMLAVSRGRMVLLSTPYGRRGFFYEVHEHGIGWKRYKVTADQCPRISKEWLAEERRVIGEWQYKQEFEVEFLDGDEQLFSSAVIDAAFNDPTVRPLWTN